MDRVGLKKAVPIVRDLIASEEVSNTTMLFICCTNTLCQVPRTFCKEICYRGCSIYCGITGVYLPYPTIARTRRIKALP